MNEFIVGDLIYDANIYDGMNTDLSDLQFYMRWLPNNKNAKILELCCGTGRLTIPIAKAGYTIHGVDITSSMLDKALEKANNENLSIRFTKADIRDLNLSEKYDLIFIPFNSVHHLYTNEDVFKAFWAVKKHLKPDGQFIFDCFNPNIKFIVESENILKQVAEYITDDGRQILLKEIMRYQSDTQINCIEWHYFINGKFHSIQNLDMRLFFPQELDHYIKSSGFTILHKFGDFDEKSFINSSNKQIFICR